MPDRLWQDNQAVLFPVGQAERVSSVMLSPGNGLQPAANDLCEIGARKQDECDLRPQ